MAVFSFFKKNKHQTFRYEPIYYDPIREDLDRREKEIKRSLETDPDAKPEYSTNISFSRKTRKASYASASLIQIIVIVMLLLTIVGWLQFGNQVFYGYTIFIPVYLYFRLKRKI